jgi:hypothetical protein
LIIIEEEIQIKNTNKDKNTNNYDAYSSYNKKNNPADFGPYVDQGLVNTVFSEKGIH